MNTVKDLPPGVRAAVEMLYHMSEQVLDRQSYDDEGWPEAYDALRILSVQLGWDDGFVWDDDEEGGELNEAE